MWGVGRFSREIVKDYILCLKCEYEFLISYFDIMHYYDIIQPFSFLSSINNKNKSCRKLVLVQDNVRKSKAKNIHTEKPKSDQKVYNRYLVKTI